MGNSEEVLQDIDRLALAFRIKLYSASTKDWQQYFHELTLDSHSNDRLFLNYNLLFTDYESSITLSGLALAKERNIKKIEVIGNDCCFTAKLGFSSPKLGQKLPNIEGSSNSRWRCKINLSSEAKQNYDLIITLDNNLQITYKKIEFRLIKLEDNSYEIEQKINSKLKNKISSIAESRQLMSEHLSQNKHYLFAIGNARSGTTALGQLLNNSSEICLGIERYLPKDNVSALSFNQKCFFDAESENYLVRPQFYEKIKDKFEQAKYIGDKRPNFTQSWRNTWLNLPQAKIIYIFRNIYDVACSYNNRASNAALGIDTSWSPTRDFSKAVRDWNKGLQEINNLAQFYRVYLVKYEDFFVDLTKIEHLFNYLEVSTKEPNLQAGIHRVNKTALSLQTKDRILSDSQTDYINHNANFQAYNNLQALYEKQFE